MAKEGCRDALRKGMGEGGILKLVQNDSAQGGGNGVRREEQISDWRMF